MAVSTQRFSISAFEKALITSANLQAVLKTLQNAFHKSQLEKPYLAIQKIHQTLQEKEQSSTLLYNCVKGVHAVVQTASVYGLTLVEIYLLPLLLQLKKKIASKEKSKGLTKKPQTHDNKCFAQNQKHKKIAEMVFQVLFFAATIKPRLNLFHQEIQEESLFKRALDSLPQLQLQYSDGSNKKAIERLRKSYLSNLKTFDFSEFSSFMQQKISQFLKNTNRMPSFYEKALNSAELAVSTGIINSCLRTVLQFADQTQLKSCFTILTKHLRRANVYMLLIANRTTVLKAIYHKYIENRTSSKEINGNQKQVSQETQAIFTKLVKTCRICRLLNQQLSEPMKVLAQILQDSQIFAKIDEDQIQKQFALNMTKNKKKVIKTIQIMKQQSKTFIFVESIPEKYQLSSLEMLSSNKFSNNQQPSSKDEMQQLNNIFEELFAQVQQSLNSIKQGINIDENVNQLKQFVNQWKQLNIHNDNKSTQKQIKRIGDMLIQKISVVNKYYLQLKNKKINIKGFKEKVCQVLDYRQYEQLGRKSIASLSNSQLSSNLKLQSLQVKSKLLREIQQDKAFELQTSQNQKLRNDDLIGKAKNGQIAVNQGKLKAEIHPITLQEKDSIESRQMTIIQGFKDTNKLQQGFQKQLIEENKSQQSVLQRRSLVNLKKIVTQKSIDKTFNKIANVSADFTNVTNNKDISRPNGKVCEVYQLNNTTWLNLSKDTQKQNYSRGLSRNYLRQKFHLQKANYANTSKSIESYRSHVSRSNSKNQNAFLSKSKEKNRSIIKRQYQYLKIKEKEQKSIGLSSRAMKSAEGSNHANFTSSVNQHKHQVQSCNIQLIVDRSSQFYPQNTSKFKKNCLKTKNLLHNSDQLQIGYVHYKKGYNLDFTLFITAKVNLDYAQFSVESNQSLKAQVQFKRVEKLEPGKQWSLKIQTSLIKLPFSMPKLIITFKKTNLTDKQELALYLPCSINKYLEFDLKSNKAESNFYQQQKNYYRTYYFKAIKKLSNPENMSKLLPFFKPIKGRDKLCYWRTECSFQSGIYTIDLVQQEKQAWYLMGKQTKGQQKHLEYILHSFYFILSE